VMMPALGETYLDLLQAVRTADLLVAADLLYAAPIVAEVAKIPWVAVTMAPISFLSRHDPPALIHSAVLRQVARRMPAVYAAVVRLAKWKIRNWGAPVYRLRRELGLPRGPEPVFAARGTADALLGMFSPLLGRAQADWPKNARVTGFVFHDRHEPMPHALREFLDRGDAPIVFTLGSAAVFDPGEFYRESAKAASQIGRRAVLLVGPAPASAPPPGENLAVAAYAPYSELFPRAAAIVHHGGVGTTAQALRAGKPMVVVPFSHDQPDNAARVVRLGVARTIARSKYSAHRVAAALHTLLADGSYARRAAEAGAKLQHENGAVAAADVVEGLISASRAPARESSASGRS
jgi:rhamnosyltransferase subunit B